MTWYKGCCIGGRCPPSPEKPSHGHRPIGWCLAKRGLGWFSLPQARACPIGGIPSGLCPPERTSRFTLPPSGPRPAHSQRRGLPIQCATTIEGAHMSINGNSTHAPSPPDTHRSASVQYDDVVAMRAARMIRVTVNLPGDLVDRLRNAVYWSPGLTLAWFMAHAIRSSLVELEATHRGPFPKRTRPLRAGRPRFLGQSMTVRPRFVGNRSTGLVGESAHDGLVSRQVAKE